MTKLVTFFFCCLAITCLQAQTDQFQFSRIDISQGLSHNQLNTILRDSQGFMWFGTMSGLNRYDGYNFKVFRHHLQDVQTPSDDFIVRLSEGPDHTLWVQNRTGLDIYNGATNTFDRNTAAWLAKYALPPATVTSITRDSRGYFWFIMNQAGLYRYDPATGKTAGIYTVTANQPCPVAMAEDKQGAIWMVLNNGLLRKIDPHTGALLFQTTVLADVEKRVLNYSIFIDADDHLWIYITGDQSGVYYYTPHGKLEHYTKESGSLRLNNNLVNGVLEDSKGNIWICTDHGGINMINKSRQGIRYLLSNDDDNKSIGQNSITTLYRDRTGIIWIGTYKKGLSYYRDRAANFPLWAHQPSDPHSLPYNDVNRFVEDAWGNLWIGTNGGGLIYYNRTTKTFRQYLHNAADPNSLSNNVIVSLCIDHAQRLWIGSYFGGLDCFDGNKFIHYQHTDDPQSLADSRVWEIMEDSHQQLWIGTMSGGLDRFDPHTNSFQHLRQSTPNGLNSDYIAALVEDKDGRLWIGTANGVDVLSHDRNGKQVINHYVNIPGNGSSLSNNNVMAMLQDKDGHIWIGTRDGLNVFDPATTSFQVFRTEQGLPDNAVLTLLEDDPGTLWMSTPNGLAHIKPYYEPHTGRFTLQCHKYDELDGLQGTAFNENAAFKTSKGELIFGGANGFNLFHPAAIIPDTQTAPLALTDLRIFNRSVVPGEQINGRVVLPGAIEQAKDITLRYNENVFSIEFAALNFSRADKNKYAYKLEGFNDDWIQTDGKMRVATYTNLDPGTYTFRVKAATSNDVWNPEELTLRITILPPFWRTGWAYALYALLLVGILWFSRHLIILRARMRFRIEQQRKEAQRMHELDMMKIRFFTNVSHEFRTPLSLILTPLEKMIRQEEDPNQQKQFRLIHRNARRLLNLVNQLLDFRKMEVQELRLHAIPGDIVKFANEISWSFSDMAEKKNIRFTVQSHIATLTASFDPDKLERILFNLISNAFKFTPEHGSITVVLDTSERDPGSHYFTIQVKDTGIGIPKDKQVMIFERFFQHDTPGSIVNQGSGIGLSITREFVRLHQGRITVESEPRQGSCFTVWLPVVLEAAVQLPVKNTVVEELTNPLLAAPEGSGEAAIIDAVPINDLLMEAALPEVHDPRKKVVLLVEDNEDFRFYLKDNLRQQFTILEAANGKEGWQKALAAHPDLIVSDISMPEMDGNELCKKIKKDQRTSHIPVILLTALASEEQQLKGLQTGANDYLTKPFNFEILLSRIHNLLHQQSIARKTFEKRIAVDPANIAVASPDEQFLQDVMAIIEKNISNPDFSVEELSKGVHMSRVALYKKLLTLTGKTPIEFIRTVRLKRAAQLLEKSEMTVAEIAWEVGFNNPKYFSRYFKLEFNVLPSQWGRGLSQ